MNLQELKSVHFVGVGGINMSAVAKLLLSKGVKVSGSDAVESEQTRLLMEKGANIVIGEDAKNVPADVELVVYTSAAPETNKERVEARARKIPELTNFEFLGKWTEGKKTVLVTGTHGKSTTTAMLGRILIEAGLDPTVIVGSKVPDFADGNLRIGGSDLWVIEGDEYARHFLEFAPFAIVVNNIELDHTDVFPNIETMLLAFRELVGKMQRNGLVVANMGSPLVARLLREEETAIRTHGLSVVPFNDPAGTSWTVKNANAGGFNRVTLKNKDGEREMELNVPGSFNALNASGAALMAMQLGASWEAVARSLFTFKGIWRRFEFLKEVGGAHYYSDYGHHPTAVKETLAAAKQAFPGQRVVLCFQPHHRNRTKNLFFDFIPSFDAADVLVLCEIYDVKGRDNKEDEAVSSKDFLDVLSRHDADRSVMRTVEYAANPTVAVERTKNLVKPGDIVIVMGAGDIDAIARKMI